jgi:hypothetical protein
VIGDSGGQRDEIVGAIEDERIRAWACNVGWCAGRDAVECPDGGVGVVVEGKARDDARCFGHGDFQWSRVDKARTVGHADEECVSSRYRSMSEHR